MIVASLDFSDYIGKVIDTKTIAKGFGSTQHYPSQPAVIIRLATYEEFAEDSKTRYPNNIKHFKTAEELHSLVVVAYYEISTD